MLSNTDYNSLLTVNDADALASTKEMDATLLRLCEIISSNKLDEYTYVRLNHKHFDMKAGEVPVFRPLVVKDICTAILMGPMPADTPGLTGKHYLFDESKAAFLAYEFNNNNNNNNNTAISFDLFKHAAFLEQFKDELVRSKASLIFGLGIRKNDVAMQETEYNEFEMAEFRSTIMVPVNMMPESKDDIAISTNWIAKAGSDPEPTDSCIKTRSGKHHGTCRKTRNSHHSTGKASNEEGFEVTPFAKMLADAESPLAKVVAQAQHAIAV